MGNKTRPTLTNASGVSDLSVEIDINLMHVVFCLWTSREAERVKHLPAMQETQVQFLHQEDALEKEMATHSNILAWKIPWMEEPGGLQSMGPQRVGHD